MRKAFLFLILTGLFAAAFTAACSDDPPKDGRINLPPREEPKDAGGDSAVAPPATCTDLTLKVGEPAACDKCAKEKCCDEVLACSKSADCEAMQKCIDPCAQDDLLCIFTCQSQHSKGSDLLQEVGACAQNRCKVECPSPQPDADIFGDF